jgi:hypothetical protein
MYASTGGWIPCGRWIDRNVSDVGVVSSKGSIHLNANEKKFVTIRIRFLERVTSFGVRIRATCNGEVNQADLQARPWCLFLCGSILGCDWFCSHQCMPLEYCDQAFWGSFFCDLVVVLS